MTSKPEIAYSSKFWKSRFERLLIPYAIWSSIFLISRVVFLTLSKKNDRLEQLLQDPLPIFFFGGASYHLYFLPLLFAGTSLVLLIPFIEKIKIRKLGLILLSVLSIILYTILESSGNSFQLGTNLAFQSFLNLESINIEQHPLLRLFLVEIAWIIRCLPYFFIALTLNRLLQDQNTKTQYGLSSFFGTGFLIFLAINLLGDLLLPRALKEILLGFVLLLLSILVLEKFSDNVGFKVVWSMGICSFGVYLIHPFVMIFVKPIIGKFLPVVTDSVSIFSALSLSFTTFIISWILVAWFLKKTSQFQSIFLASEDYL
jgi:peptidoglycan/LPS O-acetylase OafA/YrhL